MRRKERGENKTNEDKREKEDEKKTMDEGRTRKGEGKRREGRGRVSEEGMTRPTRTDTQPSTRQLEAFGRVTRFRSGSGIMTCFSLMDRS